MKEGAPSPLSLAEAQSRLLAQAAPLPAEWSAPADAIGRFLAEPLVARRTQPATDLSAMDGYALCSSERGSGRGPWRVIGESAAGHPFSGEVGTGDAVRISTGAMLPAGADTILLQEDAARDGDRLVLSGDEPVTGKHIRRAGFDFCEGATLLESGTRIGPGALALAISAGYDRLPLRRRPVLAIMDSGDELAEDPASCGPHQIPASNGAMLEALSACVPCEVNRLGPVADDSAALAEALAKAEGADVLVTTGGASVGDHDLIRPALEDWGASLAFWRVAMKPGKPVLVARRGPQIILGLPGNPVSSFVTAYLFLLPLLRVLSGAANPLPRKLLVPAATDLPPGGKRLEFVRARWDGQSVTPLGEQDSSALLALARSNALIERPADADRIEAGTDVPIYLLENGGIA